MKRILITTGLFLAITATVFGQTKNFIDQPYIEVASYADTLVTPNEIYIKIIISEKDSKDKISVEEQENKMITSLKTLNINTEKDLTTSDMLSNYKSYFLKQKEILKTKEYILKVSDAPTASKVIIELESIGISNISIHRVDHSNLDGLKNICRIKAIKNAQKKAISLTQPISQTVGSAIYIHDSEDNIDNLLQGQLSGIVVVGYGTRKKESLDSPNIQFEKIRISAKVEVKFILK